MTKDKNEFFATLENERDDKQLFLDSLRLRNEGILPKELQSTAVMIVGTGSVGSYMAEKLVRAGVGELVLIDPDLVETHNLTRSTFKAADIGRPKVEALKEHLLGINPYALVSTQAVRMEEVEKAKLREAVKRSDLLICGADSMTTQAILNRIAAHYDRPLIAPGLYKGAKGGEVVLYVPKLTPCLQCTLAGRDFGEDNIGRKKDYGTGRLEGEVALGADIHFLTGAAVKMVLSMLSLMIDPSAKASKFINGALNEGTNYLLMGMEPDYWIFKDVFADTKAQYAYQSLWLSARGREDCPVCCAQAETGDPIAEIAPNFNPDDLLALAQEPKMEAG